MLGLLIRFLNGIKSKNYVDIFLLSVPQTIFMICTFVYMDYLIIYKWLQDYSG
jgi:vacuolar-type H+-ATPase subunit I/STV1